MKKLVNALTGNLTLKIFSVVLAFLMWAFVLSDTNPIRMKSFENINVSVKGESSLEDNGLMILGDWAQELNNIRIDVEVNSEDFDAVTADDFSISLDLSSIVSPGQYTVRLDIVNKEPLKVQKITGVSKSTIDIVVDKKITREVPVQSTFNGELPAGYWASTPVITPEIVSITGAEQEINQIQTAACVINLDGMTSSYNEKASIVFYDENGNDLKDIQLEDGVPSAIVKMDVYPYKNVDINMEDLLVGENNLPAGYIIKSTTLSVTNVNIAGPSDVIDQIDTVNVETINVSNARENIVKKVKVLIPDGAQIIDGNTQIEVVVEIGKVTRSDTQ